VVRKEPISPLDVAMPVITKRIGSSADGRLKQRLIAEWRDQENIEPRPTIVQEQDESGVVVHVYVIWDEWMNMTQEERSAVITDAYWEAFGEAGLALTVAMGLLPDEAHRLGFKLD
jgi:hypothetical protein